VAWETVGTYLLELDGSARSAVRLLTGLSDEELDDVGGFDDEVFQS
jgi:hypothetical protein